MLLSLSVLLIGYFTYGTIVKFFNSNAEVGKDEIRIMTFNSHGSMGPGWTRNPTYGDEIAEFIAAENPDIVCLQEFNIEIDKQMKRYTYKYMTPTYKEKTKQAIYSKHEIIESGSLNFPNSLNNAIYADILLNRDTVRIYNIHLQSLVMRAGTFKREQPQQLFNRLSKTIEKQQEQAYLVRLHAKNVRHRKIICGDFNNTQFSRVYNTLKGNMNDSFEKKGFGFGRTYLFRFLPFRIDFILSDPEIEIKSHKNYDVRLSDHTPIMASFRLQK